MKCPLPVLDEPCRDERIVTVGETIEASSEIDASGDRFTAHKIFGLLILSLAPFLAIPAAHVFSDPATATGFFQYELPYYVANGRAAFDRGNGLFYPNPYDPDAESPLIYVHWLPWLLGLLTGPLGRDPGDVMLVLTIVAAFLFAFSTRRLVNWRESEKKHQSGAFLMAMWGGGLFAGVGLITGGWGGVLAFDPGNGMWFLNWGRNALFPTEAVYHAIVAFCWVAEMRGRIRRANICLLLLATTHPWSGLELLLTINLWRGIDWLRLRKPEQLSRLAFSASLLMIFLAYYKLWLPSFASHAELQNVWELDWSVSWTAATLAWLPLLIPAVISVANAMQSGHLGRAERFLLCALVVAAGLALHDRLIKPVQPIHFTRGYVWMPLFLIALPQLRAWWQALSKRSVATRAILGAIALAFVSDNIAFSIVHIKNQMAGDGFHLAGHERALLRELNSNDATSGRVILTESSRLNYLMPTYASVRPWLGHHFNTPQYPTRHRIWESVFLPNCVDVDSIPSDVEILILRRDRDAAPLRNSPQWRLTDMRNGTWSVWSRSNSAVHRQRSRGPSL